MSDLLPINSKITIDNINEGRSVCKAFANDIIKLSLPDTVANSQELKQLVDMQSNFEAFTIETMFMVVMQSIQALSNMDPSLHCYNKDGQLDPLAMQTIINLQSHVMNTIANFNMHIRRLPIVMRDFVKEVEMSAIAKKTISLTPVNDTNNGIVSSKPISVILREAKAELENSAAEVKQEPVISDANVVEETIEQVDESMHNDVQEINFEPTQE